MKTYKETMNVIKVGNRKSGVFWTKKGVRQGCPMSPVLFNIYLMDLESEEGTDRRSGNRKGEILAYADDIVLVAKSEQKMKGMLKKFKKYLERKGLLLSPDKSKMMVFEKEKDQRRRRMWR